MSFTVRTETRPTATGVSISQVPAEFLSAMDAEYAKVTADPTREIVLAGETAAETTLYVQYAKAWGRMHKPELSVTKSPSRKTDDALDARLSVVDASKAPKRGRKSVDTPAATAAPAAGKK